MKRHQFPQKLRREEQPQNCRGAERADRELGKHEHSPYADAIQAAYTKRLAFYCMGIRIDDRQALTASERTFRH